MKYSGKELSRQCSSKSQSLATHDYTFVSRPNCFLLFLRKTTHMSYLPSSRDTAGYFCREDRQVLMIFDGRAERNVCSAASPDTIYIQVSGDTMYGPYTPYICVIPRTYALHVHVHLHEHGHRAKLMFCGRQCMFSNIYGLCDNTLKLRRKRSGRAARGIADAPHWNGRFKTFHENSNLTNGHILYSRSFSLIVCFIYKRNNYVLINSYTKLTS